ncbi:hypothetical protein QE109_13945 [Fusibacter bizertensis]|uniref:FbpB family small basic protein n=1 Tax=Fusibacter bizertensis TaxID=1488331 RepID=A0ABT6NFX0_9FIRM|nr:hypothetical protein [Fusibacter bizertensis]MDH8679255.1 hypothetical protein [Fusibacter bizertensis]
MDRKIRTFKEYKKEKLTEMERHELELKSEQICSLIEKIENQHSHTVSCKLKSMKP